MISELRAGSAQFRPSRIGSIERLWRSLKYEGVYLRDYRLVPEARANIGRYFQFYNYERPHQSLEYRTPADLYRGRSVRP